MMAPPKVVETVIQLGQKYRNLSNLVSFSQTDSDNSNIVNELEKQIDHIPDEMLLNGITTLWSNENQRNEGIELMIEFINILFQSCSSDRIQSHKRRIRLYECILKLPYCNSTPIQVVSQLVCCLIRDSPMVENSALPGLIDLILQQGISNNQYESQSSGWCIELLPFLLNRIVKLDAIPTTSTQQKEEEVVLDYEGFTGMDYQEYIIKKLVALEWASSPAMQLLTAFKDLNLTPNQEEIIACKVVQQLPRMTIEELPPFTYQILLFSRKATSKRCQSMLFHGLVLHMETLEFSSKQEITSFSQPTSSQICVDKISESKLRDVEATIYLHFNSLFTRDIALGGVFLREMQTYRNKLGRFRLCLLLSLATLKPFHNTALDCIVDILLNKFRSVQDLSPWLEEQQVHWNDEKIAELILATASSSSSCGFELIIPSFIQLGIKLIEMWKKTDDFFTTKIANFGMSLLIAIYRHHPISQDHLLDSIMNMVITNSIYCSFYLKILGKLAVCNPTSLLDRLPRIKQGLDYLIHLTPSIAMELLHAIHPLLAIRQQFRDYLMLIIRKAVFRKEEHIRLIAIQGFFFLFTCQHAISSTRSNVVLSQDSQMMMAASSQHPSSSIATWNLFLETSGFFRRCLNQQSSIRESLYRGVTLLYQQHVSLQGALLDILIPQFMKYYDSNESSVPPLKLELCLSKTILLEPLPVLLNCINECIRYYYSSHNQNSQIMEPSTTSSSTTSSLSSLQNLSRTMDVLAERMKSCVVEDFDLDKQTNFSSTTMEGKCNTTTAKLLIGVLESFMNYWCRKLSSLEATSPLLYGSAIQEIVRLFQMIKSIEKLFTKSKKNDKLDKPDKLDKSELIQPTDKPILELPCIVVLLETQKKDQLEKENNAIQSNPEFLMYLMEKIHLHTTNLYDNMTSHILYSKVHENANNRETLLEVVPVLLLVFHLDNNPTPTSSTTVSQVVAENGKVSNKQSPKVGSKVSCVTLITFHKALLASTWSTDKKKLKQRAVIFLKRAFPDEEYEAENDDDDACISHCLEELYSMMELLMVKKKYDEADVLCKIIRYFVVLLPVNKRKVHGNTTKKLCVQMEIRSRPLAKSLISLYLLYGRSSKDVATLHQVARAIQTYLKNIDDSDVSSSVHFNCINNSTCNGILQSLLNEVTDHVKDIELVHRQLQSIYGVHHLLNMNLGNSRMISSKDQDFLKRCEDDVYERLTGIYKVFECLLQAQIDVVMSKVFIRLLARVYRVLVAIVKFRVHNKMKDVPRSLHLLFNQAQRDLNPLIAQFITFFNAMSLEMDKKNARSRSHAQKSMKMQHNVIPDFIFQLEKADSLLVKLSKLCKGYGFERWSKRRTIRDFRLNSDKVIATMKRASEEALHEEDTEEEENAEMLPLKPKRRKIVQDTSDDQAPSDEDHPTGPVDE